MQRNARVDSTGDARVASSRDARIDIIRGAGVLMIALDHLAGAVDRLLSEHFVVPFVTWSRIGWSSAAEFFVFFSGYLVGMVYSRTLAARGPMLMQARAVHRAWEIYAVNILTAVIVILLLYATPVGSPELVQSAYFSRLMEGNGAGWIAFLTLQQAPMFFEILQLYVILLLVAPLFLLLARVSVWAALAVSFALWLAVQVNPAIGILGWTFNPFAWQLVFLLGMLCSTERVLERIEAAFPRKRLIIATTLFVLSALVLKIVEKSGVGLPLVGALSIPGIDKTTLGALRLTHFLVAVVLIMQILPRSGKALLSLPARSVARIGKHSLECFCMSTILVYAGCGLLISTDSVTTLSVLLSGVALVVLLCVFAAFMDWTRSEPWRGEGIKKATRMADSSTSIDATSTLPRGAIAANTLQAKG
jgi:hypothetical protein